MKYIPHDYQQIAIAHALKHKRCGLILDMGLGKTSVVLTVLHELKYGMEIRKPLIIGTKLIVEKTWTDERDKWDHTRKLTISRIVGTEAERIAALKVKADIYAISRDNIVWLVDHLGLKGFDFDMVVVDESSSFKNRASNRFEALIKVLPRVARTIIMTGTFIPNGLIDLWAQMFLLDFGVRLDKNIGGYRARYFRPDQRNEYGGVLSYKVVPGAEKSIYNKIGDICISMQAKDWLSLKPREDRIEAIILPEMAAYKEFKRTEVLKLEDTLISPATAAVMYNKLLQFSNGAVYDDEGNFHVVSTAKLDALSEKVENLNGKPVLIFYQFRSDLFRIQERFGKLVTVLKGGAEIDAWNAGKIPVLLAHPASASHGLNLQKGGNHVDWFGVPWSSELYLQGCARVDRQGQDEIVLNNHLLCEGTIDDLVKKRLEGKIITQDDLYRNIGIRPVNGKVRVIL